MDQALDTPDLAAARARRDLGFRDDINGLRALAVIGVVAFHADRALLPGGFPGVDVFFVISGFLISRIILSECAAGNFSLAGFYDHRAQDGNATTQLPHFTLREALPAVETVPAYAEPLGPDTKRPT